MNRYITSRNGLFNTHEEMERDDYWFNIWQKRLPPYKELAIGDIVYWFNSKTDRVEWQTEIVKINRLSFNDKQQILDQNPNIIDKDYLDQWMHPEGYFMGYSVKVLEKLQLDRPKGLKLLRHGWLSFDKTFFSDWLDKQQIDSTATLDDYIINENVSTTEILHNLNKLMQSVSPERVEKLILMTIRKDAKIISALKLAADYKCQFPNCGQQILKKNGEIYLEVAHIKPVSGGGQSILGNLLVLCPNHHKEFDLGNLMINEQNPTKLTGSLNRKDFIIELMNC